MGQTFSSANSVYVQLDKQAYFAGDLINGVVCLNVIEPFEGTKLQLKVRGREETHWSREETVSSGGKTSTVTRQYGGRADIIKFDIALPLPSSTLKPAQYQFPFSTILPAALPGSFQGTLYRGSATILYYVEAHCEVPGKFKRDLRHECKLFVRQRFENPINQKYQVESAPIKTCCCCSKGTASAEVTVNKDAFVAGETVELDALIQNHSTADFSEIRANLLWRLELQGSGGRYEVTKKLTSWKYEGVRGQEVGVMRHLKGTLPSPGQVNISTESSLIKSSYSIEFEMVATALTANLKTQLAITIYEPQPVQDVFFEQPPDYWSPEVIMPVHSFLLPSAPPLPAHQQPAMVMAISEAPQEEEDRLPWKVPPPAHAKPPTFMV